ncbi:hypothetical protein AHAS_Ahas09G0015700 [Arachis hypogaea]
MTCNPKWDEIKREVTPIRLKAEDRLDILCRVFKIKLDGLIDDLKKRKIFSKILGYKSVFMQRFIKILYYNALHICLFEFPDVLI